MAFKSEKVSFSQPQNFRQKLLKAQRDIAISIVIIALEYISHAPEADACLHEQVKAHAFPSSHSTSVVVRVIQHRREGLAQSIAKCQQGLAKFLQTDTPRMILVKPLKQLSPGSEESP